MTQTGPDLGYQPRRHDAYGDVGELVVERCSLEQRDGGEHGRAEGNDLDQVSHAASLPHLDGIR